MPRTRRPRPPRMPPGPPPRPPPRNNLPLTDPLPMKKWIYLLVPVVLLSVFLVFYFSHQKQSKERESTRATAIAKKTAEEKALKEKAEQQAREDAVKKQTEREE